MTVKELIEKLNTYINHDPPDLWQLNDCELDSIAYRERCIKRADSKVIVEDGAVCIYGPDREKFLIPVSTDSF